MSRYSLRCRACHATGPADDRHTCAECLGPLEVVYDFTVVPRGRDLRHEIESGPRTLDASKWQVLEASRNGD